MRIALLLTALLLSLGLAGCTQGDPGGRDDPDRTCPAWTTRMDSYGSSHYFFYNGTTFIGPHAEDGYPPPDATASADRYAIGAGMFEFRDLPLDRIQLKFESKKFKSGAIAINGEVEGFVTDPDGAGVYVSDLRYGVSNRQESIHFTEGTAGNFTIDAILAEPGEEPRPRGIRIDWYFTPDNDATEQEPSEVGIEFTAHYWYRVCG